MVSHGETPRFQVCLLMLLHPLSRHLPRQHAAADRGQGPDAPLGVRELHRRGLWSAPEAESGAGRIECGGTQ